MSVVWLADPATGSVDLSVLGQYGVLGVFTAGLIWFAKGAYQRERDRADRLEDENRKLNLTIQDRVIPVLMSATRAAEESANLLNALQRERELLRLTQQPPPSTATPTTNGGL